METHTAHTGSKATIARKVRALRQSRRWTQAELSRRLQLSQSRLSEIERGQGSFTAEQFLIILKLFNISVSHFASARKPSSELQNALARLGAEHLQESSDVLPSSLFEEVGDVVREVLAAPQSPRHVAALAPVLLRNINRVNFQQLLVRLLEVGAERRFGWLIANVLAAVRHELLHKLPRKWALSYRRAEVVLETFLTNYHLPDPIIGIPDIFDTDILTAKTLAEIQSSSSHISRRWGIATALQPEDFVEALRASRAGG